MAVIQIVKFKLAQGVNEAEFRATNERFQRETAPKLPGLKRREATRSETGEWLLVLRYSDMQSVKAAGPSDTGELSRKFMSMIDMNSMSASFYEIVGE